MSSGPGNRLPPLMEGVFLRRYKRFFADGRLNGGQLVTAHCPNTGSLTSCLGENWPARFSVSDDPRRKLAYTLEMTHNGRTWIGVNTHRANSVIHAWLDRDTPPPGWPGAFFRWPGRQRRLRREVPYGKDGRSRVDFLLEDSGDPGSPLYIEVKNVTLLRGRELSFPDAVTTRGQKHLRELTTLAENGARCLVVYLVQRADGEYFTPAADLDPEYARLSEIARRAGVVFVALRARVNRRGIYPRETIPVRTRPASSGPA